MGGTLIVSIGYNCYISSTLRKIGLQRISYPVDWVNSFRFSGLLDFISEFSDSTFDAFERSPADADADHSNSYYIPKYAMRFPHEHKKNPNSTRSEITERYMRRFERLRSDCKKASHVVFLRTDAARTYDIPGLPPETADDYSPDVIEKAERTLRGITGHDRFTLALLTQRAPFPLIDAHFIAQGRLPVPFENGFFDFEASLPLKEGALDFFKAKLSPLQRARSTVEVRKILDRLPAPVQSNATRALEFLRHALLPAHQ